MNDLIKTANDLFNNHVKKYNGFEIITWFINNVSILQSVTKVTIILTIHINVLITMNDITNATFNLHPHKQH